MKVIRHFKFFAKNFLYNHFFDSFGYYRTLKNFKIPDYDHEKNKSAVRKKHHGKGGWKTQWDNGFVYRDYENYEEYVDHQKVKFDEMLAIKGGFAKKDIIEYRLKFYNRFSILSYIIPPDGHLLCLGARQGTEVEVLRDLGFSQAMGIDLNPGANNPWVKHGDFMAIEAADHSLDLIYTNAVDHAFNLDAFFKEHARVIKKDGYALYDLNIQSAAKGAGPFEAVEWDREERVFLLMLKYFKQVIRVETEDNWKWVLLKGPIMD
ncbi:MAG: methyltransferase domain-containing protein [Magnetococcales bacterium]|nr:methyltransferase domain-containing protein [Magnetococcales bacterium]